MQYCESTHQTKRFKTREVLVGNVGVGGANPIRIQSMTTSNTRDIEATIQQIIRLADAGCEIARVTVQGKKEAEACEFIKNGLVKKGYMIPLVADIHFYPPAAMLVTEFVDKIRINPGNYVDRRASFKVIEYTDALYAEEIEKIEEKFTPLVEKCKKYKRAMRIGTNHGSLSDRIMNRYGDTPQGMVESALEFAKVCRKNDYHDIVFSMKSSNPQVMVLAYRLLVVKMYELNWDYPLHLGVTEAGSGEDGRIKSAMGIGALLLDGIGDTIRVSLTEDPWLEIDPCQRLIGLAKNYEGQGVPFFEEKYRCIENIQKREVTFPKFPSMHRDGVVLLKADETTVKDPLFYSNIGCEKEKTVEVEATETKVKLTNTSVDHLVFECNHTPSDLKLVELFQDVGISFLNPLTIPRAKDVINMQRFAINFGGNFLDSKDSKDSNILVVENLDEKEWEEIESISPTMILLKPKENRLHFSRQFFNWLQSRQIKIPVILNFVYSCSKEDLVIQAATECGALFCDGLGDGIFLEGPYELSFLRNLSFNILQSARMRMIKTDFISCPSCGRTLFDLQDVTKRIQSKTAHLPGVKIAIMGCIVNGPGEMADADFGYVGSKPGKIDLYVGKKCLEKNIDFEEADERLISLIKAHDRWVEPIESVESVELVT